MGDINHQQPRGLARANRAKAQRIINELVEFQKQLGLSNREFVKLINGLHCVKKHDLPVISLRVYGSWRAPDSGNLPKSAATWGAHCMLEELKRAYNGAAKSVEALACGA